MTSVNDSNGDKFNRGGVCLRMSEWTEKGRIRRNWTYQKIGNNQAEEKTPEPKETKRSVTVPRRTAEEQKRSRSRLAKKEEQTPVETPVRKEEEKKKEGGQEELEPSLSSKLDGLTRMVQMLTEKVNHIEASVSEIQHVKKTAASHSPKMAEEAAARPRTVVRSCTTAALTETVSVRQKKQPGHRRR